MLFLLISIKINEQLFFQDVEILGSSKNTLGNVLVAYFYAIGRFLIVGLVYFLKDIDALLIAYTSIIGVYCLLFFM